MPEKKDLFYLFKTVKSFKNQIKENDKLKIFYELNKDFFDEEIYQVLNNLDNEYGFDRKTFYDDGGFIVFIPNIHYFIDYFKLDKNREKELPPLFINLIDMALDYNKIIDNNGIKMREVKINNLIELSDKYDTLIKFINNENKNEVNMEVYNNYILANNEFGVNFIFCKNY